MSSAIDTKQAMATPKKRSPSPLARALLARIAKVGITKKQAAATLGFSYVHLLSLCKDVRQFAALRREKMASLAEFLGVPLINCYVMAGNFAPSDFVVKASLGDHLGLTLTKLRSDPEWSTFAPTDADWLRWPADARVLMTLLYERMSLNTTRRLIAGGLQ